MQCLVKYLYLYPKLFEIGYQFFIIFIYYTANSQSLCGTGIFLVIVNKQSVRGIYPRARERSTVNFRRRLSYPLLAGDYDIIKATVKVVIS